MASRHLVVVPHTHWDREWYRTHEEFRYRLVRLLDGLLDLLEGDPDFRHFTLDGQTIVLEDYLEVRPGARERIAKLVREGRLLVGPWYVLPDEWLVSGEALIRNLRRGLAQALDFGGAMQIGYVPDQFGHVGQLPQIFAGFGFEAAVLWRGVGADVNETAFEWEAPDGTRIFAIHLCHGYGNAVHLPAEPERLARRLEQEARALGARSRIPTLLLMNGSDHVAPQPELPRALERALARASGLSGEIGTLPGFVARARAEAPRDLTRHRGELRSGLRAPLLEGCASARLPQKRADFRNDRLLTRYLEPLAAWLESLGGDGDPELLDLAWRIALQNHPHDSICGCSIDAVHEQMETRFARVAEIAGAHLRRVTADLARRIAAPGDALVVWNPGATGTAQAEGSLELDRAPSASRAPRLHLCDADGRRLPLQVDVEEPGQTLARYALDAAGAALVLRGFPPEFTGLAARGLRWRRRGGRMCVDLLLGADGPRGFDLTASVDACVEAMRAGGIDAVDFRVLRLPRLRLRFVDRFPGCGLRVYRVATGLAECADAPRGERRGDGGAAIENAHWRVEVGGDGRVRLIHRDSGVEIPDALRIVSEGDRGDEYSFDPVPGGEAVQRPDAVRVRLARASEAEAAIAIDARYRVPAGLARDRARRTRRRVVLPVRVELCLARALDRLDVSIEVDNSARDHRLRAQLRAPFEADAFEVESAFELAERPIAPAPDAFGSERPAEFPVGATPQRSFATLRAGARALTLANRGAPEVEALADGDGRSALAVTLLRAVGWLSREDLALRPGHAGPPIATPGAQVPGAHRVELSLRLHAAGDAMRTAAAHHFAAPPLLFAGRGTPGAPLADGARLLEVDDPRVVVSAIEPRPGGEPLIRLWNAEPGARRLQLRWNGPGARRLARVDLAGRPLAPASGPGAPLRLAAAEIVSLRPA